MEFLERIGDWFGGFTGWVERTITRFFGSSNERQIRQIGFVREKNGDTTIVPGSIIDRINNLEPEFERLSEGELKGQAEKFRERLADGQTLDDILPEAFAAVRESSKRFLKMRHYDVQMVGGHILHQGKIAEMVTGEGKTLVGTLPAFLNALAGHVHLITVNDYLALRDMEWMGPIHMGLGLTVGAIQNNMDPFARQKQYACDITYGTNNEFGFDYLRDNMKPAKEYQVQGPLDFAIIDEIDNILIDEARTPLIISGPAEDDITKYPKANRIALQLKKGVDFEVKEKEHTCHLTEEGIRRGEELAGVESFYTVGNMEWPHLIDNALRAHHLFKRDSAYMVKDGEVVIVDEHTGRPMPGRQWSDGLHQAVEAKEGVKIKEESQTLATITLQNYFKLYKKLGGMTGTAMTEAAEFLKIYELDVVAVPTNRPLKRINYPDKIFSTEKDKWNAVVEEVREIHPSGRPILVGTVSIEKSELISNKLGKYGIDHKVLNAKKIEQEAEYISQAGRKGAVTIATNMAGRGTDIILGGNPENRAWEILKQTYSSRMDVPKSEWDALTDQVAEEEGMAQEGREVATAGGLHVIGTERHDSRRIDLQLRGRAGRQGDPGSSRFFVSLDDDLMRLFAGDFVRKVLTSLGWAEGEAIESKMVTRRLEGAQKKREETHFEQRKNLLEYDEVMDDQRKRVYAYRQEILDGANCRDKIHTMIERLVEKHVPEYLDPLYRWETIARWVEHTYHLHVDPPDLRGMNFEQAVNFLTEEAHSQAYDTIQEQIDENLPEEMDQAQWNWQALSHWVNSQYTLNTNDRELKKIGRENLHSYLYERALESIARYDFSTLEIFLEEHYPLRSLAGWLSQQFALEITPEEFSGLEEAHEYTDFVLDSILKSYQEKEVKFPVSVGMTNFLSGSVHSETYDREGLIQWANNRFGSEISLNDLKQKPRQDVENLLTDCSRTYFVNGDVTSKMDDYLDEAYSGNGGSPEEQSNPQAVAALGQLARWANEEFHTQLAPEDFQSLSKDTARQKIMAVYNHRYRPELSRAERDVLLSILDSAWKDHLYYMDHLKSGIGLVGYAQRDAKVEYKREGSKAYEMMWDRIANDVTETIFRMEQQGPEFVGSLWRITGTIKDAPTEAAPQQEHENNQYDDDLPSAIETIRNNMPKVGRNDPCPCGSGKKYKKCHGA